MEEDAPKEEEAKETAAEAVARIRSQEDFFEILRLDRHCSQREITVSYRKLALLLHPDKCNIKGCEAAFQKVSTAFSCLRDPQQRNQYEQLGRVGSLNRIHSEVDPHEMFREMFEAMQQQSRRGGYTGYTYTYASGDGATFAMSGHNIFERIPILKLLPPEYSFALVMITFVYFLGHVMTFLLPRIPYFIVVFTIVPPRLRPITVAVLVTLGLTNVI